MSTLGTFDVSRETMDRLKIYASLLRKWNPAINLVSKSTLENLWTRHFEDSLQIFDLASSPVDHWVDLGSGGGFPGIIVALFAEEKGFPARVTLVESDARKCVFLRSVLRETQVTAQVINDRVENLSPLNANVVSARALADLSTLFDLAHPHLLSGGYMVFPKGERWEQELETAQTKWKFEYQVAKSKTNDGSVIISVSGVTFV